MGTPVGKRTCNSNSNPYQNDKIFCKQRYNSCHGSAEHFADTNFFYATLCCKVHQPPKTKAGNEHSQYRKYFKERIQTCLCFIKRIKLLVQKIKLEDAAGKYFLKRIVDFTYHARNVCA